MKSLDDFTIAIVGLGLMGGSLAMALKRHRVGRVVMGADADPQAVTQAMACGAIDARCDDFAACDLIVLAMPVRAIVAWLNTHGETLRPACLVMDLGSTKQAIVAAMERLAAQCVGGHPMCGKETSGIASADAKLFDGAKFVLTPTTRTSTVTLRLAQSLVTRIGAQPVVMDAASHDRAVAAISHMPYLLSASLVNAVSATGDDNALRLAASGYAGMTRLAASDPQMMSDIIATNRANIVAMIGHAQAALADLKRALIAGDEAAWRAELERARNVIRDA